VVHPPRQILDALVEAAAKRHVQLLHAAADRQHWHAVLDGGADQGQGRAVALDVLGRALGVGRAVIMSRINVAAAAREHEPVQPRQDIGDHRLAGRRQQDGDAVDRAEGDADVAVARGMIGRVEQAEALHAARNSDQRLQALISGASERLTMTSHDNAFVQ
jgi:hypothetical protein